ncbi:MAG: hypothetical protein COU47_03160 [Candidatus Niyogibacteria bacterium CG10_big_fil_rev_8_21_14_0_10_46_36]|uniref:DUF418 domain-containing protein n=1 Tax=Candidatus Niyogibacteria bacterium CG10_big_fil_rev_8_21_14_0_10_46_36 TaxID=1974726 RepID=A0A2H0TEF7_9BACT|nr:MAG: hypothetical protein COU47_03160 [Candidatus Niyogibacteria bacterium CG10_big_fil_rev_8_21_14_0_10_46_36]
MAFRDVYEKEKYIVIRGQSRAFRIIKYIVISGIAGVVYAWQGLSVTGYVFLALFAISICVHFLFRWKTRGWTQPWGLYKKILPVENNKIKQ